MVRLRDGLTGSAIVESIDISRIVPSKLKIRRDLGDLTPLISSIKHVGILEPILVRPLPENFEIVCGHRRFNACKKIGFKEIPCIVCQFSEQAAFETGLVENLQRENLDPIDEALAFKEYVLQFGWGGITRLSKKIGKSEEYVSHRLLLLDLPSDVLHHMENKDLSPSGARELVWLKDPVLQHKMMSEIVGRNMSVKKIHQAVKVVKSGFSVSDAVEMIEDEDKNRSWIPSYRSNKRDHDSILVDKTILVLRLSMIRLDRFVEEAQSDYVKQYLLNARYRVHQILDECMQKRVELLPS